MLSGLRKKDGEDSSTATLTISSSHSARVFLHNRCHDMEPESGARDGAGFSRDIRPKNSRKQFLLNPRTIIGNNNRETLACLLRLDLDTPGAMHDLRRVQEQVCEDALPILG